MYMEGGRGCRVRDVDGNEYVDLFMGFGPFLLGYAHPEVDGAATRQIARGHLLSLNHPLHLEFVERVVARVPGAEMGAFFRSGSEATTAALRIARRATGRRVVARCGYHGWHDWCLPLEDFVPEGLDGQVLEFRASEPSTLASLFDAHPGRIAAVIVAPEMVIPTRAEPFHAIAELCRQNGAVFVLDEVKTALRVPPGTIQERVGVRPDLTALSKALGNGWPVAALVGRRAVMESGAGMHYSATYHGDTAAMAAALKTLELCDALDVACAVTRLGERLIAGLDAIARSHGLPAEAYGEPVPSMPFFRFTHPDAKLAGALRDTFFEEAAALGVLLHPRHMWFMSHAHTEADVELVLARCDDAMKATRRAHPSATAQG
jgi:glutamate-1-semialdehyde aminotransferase